MNPFLDNLRQFLGRLSTGQKASLAAVLIGGIGVIGGMSYWASQPDYALLFNGLDPAEAQQTVEALQAAGTKYEIRDGGTAIYVPREKVHEHRLQLAASGTVSDGMIGYELFDEGTLGMTDFMQKLNLKRALEGELARTIKEVRGVQTARVHLVLPERSPFRDRQVQPTASVVLHLKGNSRLRPDQVEGITALVAGSVEGLDVTGVTVLDARGELLSNTDAADSDAALSSQQLRIRREMEEHLAKSGQGMLDRVLGVGNAVVRVAAEMDFSRTVTEIDAVDPETQTVVSEERMEESAAEDRANSMVRNYEVTRRRQRQEAAIGGVQRLTVSVILDYKRPEPGAVDAEGNPLKPQPFSEEEIREMETLVKNSVGFNPERGDRFTIHQTPFDTSADVAYAMAEEDVRTSEQVGLYLRYGLLVLALGGGLWLLRSATQRVSVLADPNVEFATGRQLLPPVELDEDGRPLPARYAGDGGGDDDEELVLVDDVYTSKLSKEAKARLKAKDLMYDEIKQAVLARPEDCVELLRSWLVEDQEKQPA